MSESVPVVLAFGSNLGDREANLLAAFDDLSKLEGFELTATSPIVETTALKPEGFDESAPEYLNAVALGRTTLAPKDLLARINEIERDHGRTRDVRWGDRTLDIDIIAFADLQSDDPVLELPHPRAWNRAFVLAPWVQLDPDAILPGRGRVDALLSVLDEGVRPWKSDR